MATGLVQAVAAVHEQQRQTYLESLGDLHVANMNFANAQRQAHHDLANGLLEFRADVLSTTTAMFAFFEQKRLSALAIRGIHNQEDADKRANLAKETAARPERWIKAYHDRALERLKNAAHTVLAAIALIDPTGIIGAIASVLDGAIYLLDGDYLAAGQCFIGAIPGLGKAATAARLLSQSSKVLRLACPVARWGGLIIGMADATGKIAKGDLAGAGWAMGMGILGFLTGGCFQAGTQVITGIDPLTGKYLTTNIEDLRPGDLVLSRDQNDPDAPLEFKPVLQTYTSVVDHLLLLTIQNPDGTTETLATTDQHPFWVENPAYGDEGGMWVRAGLLTAGMTLLDDQGNPVTLLSTQTQLLPNGVQVYNLEVDADHTYFVLDANGVPVWVHNGNPNGCTGKIDHQRTVARLESLARAEFAGVKNVTIHANKSIEGLTGLRRRPDVWVESLRSGGSTVAKVYEAARMNAAKTDFVTRELKKMSQYNSLGILWHFESVR